MLLCVSSMSIGIRLCDLDRSYVSNVRDSATVSASSQLGTSSTAVLFRLFTTNSSTTDKQILISNIVSGTSEIIFSLTYKTA